MGTKRVEEAYQRAGSTGRRSEVNIVDGQRVTTQRAGLKDESREGSEYQEEEEGEGLK